MVLDSNRRTDFGELSRAEPPPTVISVSFGRIRIHRHALRPGPTAHWPGSLRLSQASSFRQNAA